MRALTITSGRTTARILDYGARIERLAFDGRDVFVAYDDRSLYREDEPYLGAALGRTSGRVGGSQLTVGGETHRLDANAGSDHLHGGGGGFANRTWTVAEHEEDRLVLTLTSADGDQGYPGRVEARIAFTVGEDGLRVGYEAKTDAPTPISMTHHPYVRLSGSDVLDHTVQANVTAWTPLTENGIPTGEVADIGGAVMDIREPKRMDDLLEALDGTLDHGIVCPSGVRVRVADGQNALTITSDHTHCQVFGAGTVGEPLGRYMGLAIEPQGWPDAEKNPAFEQRILLPGETYRRTVLYSDG